MIAEVRSASSSTASPGGWATASIWSGRCSPSASRAACPLADGDPDLARAGAGRAQTRPSWRDIAERHGLTDWTTDLDAALARDDVQIYFDAQVTQQREKAIRAAIEAGKHIYTEKPLAETLDRRGRAGPGRRRRRRPARRGAGQALPARAAQAQAARSTAASSAGSCRCAASSATGSSRATGSRPSARPGTTGRPTAAASCWTCSRTGTTCWSSCSRRSGRCTARRRDAHPARGSTRPAEPYQATADDAAYGIFELDGGIVAADQLLLGGPGPPRRAGRVPGRRHRTAARSPACATAASSTGRPPPSRSGTRTCRPPSASASSGSEVPDNEDFDNGFKVQWEAFLRHVVEDGPVPLGLLRPAPAACSSPSSGCDRPGGPAARGAVAVSVAAPNDRSPAAGPQDASWLARLWPEAALARPPRKTAIKARCNATKEALSAASR